MRHRRFRLFFLLASVLLIGSVIPTGSAAQLQEQGTLPYGTVVALQGTPHLWFADKQGILHWGGDTRALSGRHINWNYRTEVSLNDLHNLPIGDPWLSTGLLKDGAPIYLVKWESDWQQPQLLHIQSIDDVELFGINGSNYGRFVLDRTSWEQRFGIATAGLQRGRLAVATSLSADFVPLSSGIFHTCALRSDGSAACWGWNSEGQSAPPPSETFIAISSSRDHTCALRADGTPVCWGSNILGQKSPPSGEFFASISSGEFHTCALRADGTPVCWGNNELGQTSPPPGERFAAISSGRGHTCALRADGSAVCWGWNSDGQALPPPGEMFALPGSN